MSRSKSGTTGQRPLSLAREALENPFRLWGPEITEEILQLARNRVLDGGNLSTRKDLPKRVVKMAIIATLALNRTKSSIRARRPSFTVLAQRPFHPGKPPASSP